MGSSLYSQSKVLWHLDRLEKLRLGEQPPPVHVQLILSDLCNQDCHFCAYRMSEGLTTELFATSETHNPNRKIPTDKAREIIHDCAAMGVRAIQFTGGGEPLVHKDADELFGYAQSLGMQTALVTNGVRLKNTEAVNNMTWIRISVDAGRPETYAKVRNVSQSHWRKVWDNIDRLEYDGTLGIGFVVTPENYTEIAECAYLAKRHGADNIRIGAVFSSKGLDYYQDCLEDILRHIEVAKMEADEPFEVIDLFGRRLNDLSGTPTEKFCGYQYLTIYIGADLNVYRCCNLAYTKKGWIASLQHKRLTKAAKKFSYTGFDARNCSYCQFRGQNEVINATLNQPEHGDFV